MDPLSVTVSCVSLIATTTKASIAVTEFVRDVRDARRDLDGVSRELLSLKSVLEYLKEDTEEEKGTNMPDALNAQIIGILGNVKVTVLEIEAGLRKSEKSKLGRSGYWTMGGKSDVNKLRSSLESQTTALDLALQLVNTTIVREVKRDTTDIKEDTTDIKEDTTVIRDDTAKIREELELLRAKLTAMDGSAVASAPPVAALANLSLDANTGNSAQASNMMLQRYLDNLTDYADSICDPDDGFRRSGSPLALHSRPVSPISEETYVDSAEPSFPKTSSIPPPLPDTSRKTSESVSSPEIANKQSHIQYSPAGFSITKEKTLDFRVVGDVRYSAITRRDLPADQKLSLRPSSYAVPQVIKLLIVITKTRLDDKYKRRNTSFKSIGKSLQAHCGQIGNEWRNIAICYMRDDAKDYSSSLIATELEDTFGAYATPLSEDEKQVEGSEWEADSDGPRSKKIPRRYRGHEIYAHIVEAVYCHVMKRNILSHTLSRPMQMMHVATNDAADYECVVRDIAQVLGAESCVKMSAGDELTSTLFEEHVNGSARLRSPQCATYAGLPVTYTP